MIVEFKEKIENPLRAEALNKYDHQIYLKWLQNSGIAYMNRVELAGDASRIVRSQTGELNMPDVLTSQPLVATEEKCEQANYDAYDPTGSENFKYFVPPMSDYSNRFIFLMDSKDKRITEFKSFIERLYQIKDVHFVMPLELGIQFKIMVPDALLHFLFEGYTNFGHSLDLFRSGRTTWFGAGLLSKDLQRVHLYRYEPQQPQRVLDYLASLDIPYPFDVERLFNGTLPKLGLPNRLLNYKYFNNLRDWNLFRFEYLTLNETLTLPFREVWSSMLTPEPYDCERFNKLSDELNSLEQEPNGPASEYFRRMPNYPSLSIGQGVINSKIGVYPWAFTEAARLELPLRYARDPDYVDKQMGKARNHFARFGTSFTLLDPDADRYVITYRHTVLLTVFRAQYSTVQI